MVKTREPLQDICEVHGESFVTTTHTNKDGEAIPDCITCAVAQKFRAKGVYSGVDIRWT